MEFKEKSNQYAQLFETSAVTAAKRVEDDKQVLNKYQNQLGRCRRPHHHPMEILKTSQRKPTGNPTYISRESQ